MRVEVINTFELTEVIRYYLFQKCIFKIDCWDYDLREIKVYRRLIDIRICARIFIASKQTCVIKNKWSLDWLDSTEKKSYYIFFYIDAYILL